MRKKLTFDSEKSSSSSTGKTWDKCSTSDSLQSDIELEESPVSSPNATTDNSGRELPEERMASMPSETCRSQNLKPEARYGNPEVAHSSECDASSELSSEDEKNDEYEILETPGSERSSVLVTSTLNRTFSVPGETETADPSAIVIKTPNQSESPVFDLSELSGTFASLPSSSADGALSTHLATSEVAQNQLTPSPIISLCLTGSSPPVCQNSTQKNRLSPSTGLSSSGSTSTGGLRQRRRSSAHFRNIVAGMLQNAKKETCSENPLDAESARQLMEFGEDYRNELDSLSDCPSSSSTGFRPQQMPKRSPPKRLKQMGIMERLALNKLGLLDSDSDVEDFVHIVETSTSHFVIARNTFHKLLNTSKLESAHFVRKYLQYFKFQFQCVGEMFCN